MDIDEVIAQIQRREPATSFLPVSEEWLDSLDREFPDMPGELRRLYRTYGYGPIGQSRYMIHFLLEPEDIFDPETARQLAGVRIVGDDFAGNCEAYDTANGWLLGSIDSSGDFRPYDGVYSSFTNFLEEWFVADAD